MDSDTLFDATDLEVAPVVTADMGHDAARTARRRALIAAGIHPATRLTLRDGDDTCGSCAHLFLKPVPQGRWWKCTQPLHDGHGPDMRKSWPACISWAPRNTGDGTQ